MKVPSRTGSDSHDVSTSHHPTATRVRGRAVAAGHPTPLVGRLLVLLFEVHLGVSLTLVAPGELASTELAGEGLLARVRADVCGQVVAAAKGAHADATLKGFVTCVDAQVARQFVGAGEPPVAVLRRAGVRTLVHGGFAGAVGVLPGSDGLEGEGLGWRVVLGVVLLATYEPWVNLLLVFERSDGLQGCDGWGVDPDGVHGLEGLVLHHADLSLVVEQVVVGYHGEEATVHRGLGGGVVVTGWVREGGAGGGAVMEGDLVLVQVTAGGISR